MTSEILIFEIQKFPVLRRINDSSMMSNHRRLKFYEFKKSQENLFFSIYFRHYSKEFLEKNLEKFFLTYGLNFFMSIWMQKPVSAYLIRFVAGSKFKCVAALKII